MSTQPEAPRDETPLQGVVLARRRALLSGLGKGGAVLAVAAKPIQSLAGSTIITCQNGTTKVHATVSGCGSAVNSIVAGGGVTQVDCKGYHHSYWCQTGVTWPSGCSKSATFYDCFQTYLPNGTNKTVMNCLKANDDSSIWCAAYLNSLKFYSAGTFPYSTTTTGGLKGVRQWYTDSQKSQAQTLWTLTNKATS
ncbi:hypothetical protein [Pelomonas sp. KK5]|uniref:hypothetical protein n=1 Tax=Pelomonas sp. KK5 TaxID=1855730 RepID=UPI00097C17E6|nr:hypothetical protein [Pelomonas sp. KK5]